MIQHRAIRVKSARSDTRIQTLLLNTGQRTGAILVDHTLRSTIRRCSEHAGDARTYGMILLNATVCVWSAR